ncbi:MAG TPA: efflux RND transporter periplasmic adaptor subunit [Candidatus Sulfotelmatobacter sp.]|nr:efflux RND transporter periplasmic adaptor subunit [Candidatus Sulfotelmatobacter sp.]
MKKVFGAIAVALLMVVSFVAGRRRTAQPATIASPDSRRVLYWVDPMHPDYKSDHPGIAPDCGMPLEPVYADSVSAPVKPGMPESPHSISIDTDKQQLFGIHVAPVESASGASRLRVLGRVSAEDTRVYKVDTGMDGFIRDTFNDSVGQHVKKDQKLATCYGGDSLAVASGFLAATAGVPGATGKDGSRTVPFPGALNKQGVSSIQGYTDRLRNLGMSEAQIQEMNTNRQLPETIDVVSPVDGFIISRSVTPGQHFDRSMEFYRIADLSKVWIVADVYGNEAPNVKPGSAARVTLSNSGKTFTAHVTDILPQVDPNTRTLKLRLEAENPGFALRPDMFVDVELPVAAPSGLTVPIDALIDSGREQRVYVERSSGVFEPRAVQVGWRSGDRVQILSGLTAGERVVTAGTFLVDSESRLKAGRESSAQPHAPASPKSNVESGVAVSSGKVKDAACGMSIDAAKAVAEGNTLTRDGVTYYFCSDRCKKKFSARPEHYLASNPSGHHS